MRRDRRFADAPVSQWRPQHCVAPTVAGAWWQHAKKLVCSLTGTSLAAACCTLPRPPVLAHAPTVTGGAGRSHAVGRSPLCRLLLECAPWVLLEIILRQSVPSRALTAVGLPPNRVKWAPSSSLSSHSVAAATAPLLSDDAVPPVAAPRRATAEVLPRVVECLYEALWLVDPVRLSNGAEDTHHQHRSRPAAYVLWLLKSYLATLFQPTVGSAAVRSPSSDGDVASTAPTGEDISAAATATTTSRAGSDSGENAGDAAHDTGVASVGDVSLIESEADAASRSYTAPGSSTCLLPCHNPRLTTCLDEAVELPSWARMLSRTPASDKAAVLLRALRLVLSLPDGHCAWASKVVAQLVPPSCVPCFAGAGVAVDVDAGTMAVLPTNSRDSHPSSPSPAQPCRSATKGCHIAGVLASACLWRLQSLELAARCMLRPGCGVNAAAAFDMLKSFPCGRDVCRVWRSVLNVVGTFIRSSSDADLPPAYASALSHLVDRVPPSTFLAMLPSDGNTAFFLPFIRRCAARSVALATVPQVVQDVVELDGL